MSKSRILAMRLEDICPKKYIEDCTLDELINDTNVAFEIIGYSPTDLNKSVEEIYSNTRESAVPLWEFVYDVWSVDS